MVNGNSEWFHKFSDKLFFDYCILVNQAVQENNSTATKENF